MSSTFHFNGSPGVAV